MLVIDASVALKWFLDEEGSDAAMAVAARPDLVAPDLLAAEVANALWRAVRIGRLAQVDGLSALARLPGAFARLVPCSGLLGRAFSIAGALDHPVYDCIYLALAEREGTLVVTADHRFGRRTAGTQWEAMVRDLGAAEAD